MAERPGAGDVPASAASAEVEVLTGVTCGVLDDGERLLATRREVVITDHGTGAGGDLTCLFVRPDEADRLAPATDPSTRSLPTLELDLRTVDGRADLVEVDDPARAPDRRVIRPRRARLADQLLARFTHERLDPGSLPPCLHAGAVADPSGRAALVLGRSGAGKSTLIAHLVHQGLDLINDEQVTVHPRAGLVGGFTRPLAVKAGGLARLPPTVGPVPDGEFGALVTAAQLGGHHRLTGRPVLLVLPERSPDHAAPSWDLLTPGQAVEVLCANNLDLVAKPVRALEAFAWLAAGAVAVRLRYEDSSAASAVVTDLLADAARLDEVSWSVSAAAAGSHEPDAGGAPAPAVDVLEVSIGDEVVAYHQGTRAVLRLNPAGADVWHRLPVPSDGAENDRFVTELARLGFVQ